MSRNHSLFNPNEQTPDLSALLSGDEFESFKKRIALHLRVTGYKRYEMTFNYGTARVAWVWGEEEVAMERLRRMYAYDGIRATDTQEFERMDIYIRGGLDA